MSGTDVPTPKPRPSNSIMDDVPPVKRSVSAAALLAARTGQPQPTTEDPKKS